MYYLGMAATKSPFKNVRVLRCDPTKPEDKYKCQLHCVRKGFRTGRCLPYRTYHICKCHN